jgi:hypothetical protein
MSTEPPSFLRRSIREDLSSIFCLLEMRAPVSGARAGRLGGPRLLPVLVGTDDVSVGQSTLRRASGGGFGYHNTTFNCRARGSKSRHEEAPDVAPRRGFFVRTVQRTGRGDTVALLVECVPPRLFAQFGNSTLPLRFGL